jgi:hypothetical protein
MTEKNDEALADLRQKLAVELAAAPDQWIGIDLQESVAFLIGRSGSYGGREFLEAESLEERSSRQALARLLRGPQPLSPIIRNLLANLIDAESRDPRQLCFKRRGTTRQPASIRDYDIAYFIAWQVETGKLMKNAKADAMDLFKMGEAKLSKATVPSKGTVLSKATVNRAWGKHGPAMRDHVRGILSELRKPNIPG